MSYENWLRNKVKTSLLSKSDWKKIIDNEYHYVINEVVKK